MAIGFINEEIVGDLDKQCWSHGVIWNIGKNLIGVGLKSNGRKEDIDNYFKDFFEKVNDQLL